MDGVFIMCRATPECTRLDGHDDACNVPVAVRRRTHASRIRFLAGELQRGAPREAVIIALRSLADELP